MKEVKKNQKNHHFNVKLDRSQIECLIYACEDEVKIVNERFFSEFYNIPEDDRIVAFQNKTNTAMAYQTLVHLLRDIINPPTENAEKNN